MLGKDRGVSRNKACGVVLLFTLKSNVSRLHCADGAFSAPGTCQSGLTFVYPPPASQLIDYKCSFACKEQSLRLNNKI